MNRRGAGYGDIRRAARWAALAADVSVSVVDPLTLLGSSLLQLIDFRYGEGVGYTESSGITSAIDLSGNGNTETPVSNKQVLNATGGPGGTPESEIADNSQRMKTTGGTILAAGGRPTLLMLQRLPGSGLVCALETAEGEGQVCIYYSGGPHSFFGFMTEADDDVAITSPVPGSAYAFVELAFTSPASCRYDGVLVTPQPTTDDVAQAILHTNTGINGFGQGAFCWKALIDRPLTSEERAAIHRWLNESEINGLSFGRSLPT